jgi:hypothetical protein
MAVPGRKDRHCSSFDRLQRGQSVGGTVGIGGWQLVGGTVGFRWVVGSKDRHRSRPGSVFLVHGDGVSMTDNPQEGARKSG